MAVSAVAGVASALGAGAAGMITGAAFWGTVFSTAGLTAFAIGAGLSVVNRALMPKIDSKALQGLTTTVRNPTESRKLIYGEIRTGGNIVYVGTSGTGNKYLNMAIVFASHEVEEISEVYFDDKVIWTNGGFTSGWGTYVSMNVYNGTQQHGVSTGDPLLKAAFPNLWTDDHILEGITYISIQLDYDADKFANGIPNITAKIKGKKVFDPRTSITAWSDNSALCLYDYMRDNEFGLGEDAANFNLQSVIDAANLCDESVALSGGGTQKRYTTNGVVDTGNSIKTNIEAMTSTMAGFVSYSGGEFYMYGAEYRAPVVTITDDMIVGSIDLKTRQSRKDLFNAVKGTFISADDNYIATDYPAQKSALYASEDGGEVFLDMVLPMTVYQQTAQRLAKISLLKSRQQKAITIPMNLNALKFKAGDTIAVTSPKLGFEAKEFEVLGYDIAYGDQIIVNVQALETSAAVYDWTTNEEQPYDFGGALELYNGDPVAPSNVAATASTFLQDDGTHTLYLDVTWTPPTDAFFDFYRFKYVVDGKTTSVDTRDNSHRILATSGSEYSISVTAINLLGRESAAATTTKTPVADTQAPDVPTLVSATGGVKSIVLTWDNPTQSDFKHVEIYVNSVNSLPATPTAKVDGESYILGGLSAGNTRYFWLKSVDFTGNKSAATTAVSASAVTVAAGTDVDVDFAQVTGTTKPADNATKNTGALADKDTVATNDIDDDSVTIDKIANTLQSTNYVAGTSGWKLTTDGTFEAGNGTFRGALTATSLSLDVGITIGSTNLDSTVVSGASAGATALQNNDTSVNLGLTGGSVGGITITSSSLYAGAGNWANADTGFYLDNTGKFSLDNKLSFDPVTDTLRVAGLIEAVNLTVTGEAKFANVIADQVKVGSITYDMLAGDVKNAFQADIALSTGGTAGDYQTGSQTIPSTIALPIFAHGQKPVELTITASKTGYHYTSYDSISRTATYQIQRSTDNVNWTNVTGGSGSIVISQYDISNYYGGGSTAYYHAVNFSAIITDDPAIGNYYYRVTFSAGSAFNDSNITVTSVLTANEAASGVTSSGGNADTLDNLDSTKFMRTDQNTSTTGTITASGGNSTQWNTAYTYSQAGHLPLAGGSLTGTLAGTKARFLDGGVEYGSGTFSVQIGKSSQTASSLLITNELGAAHTWFGYTNGNNYITSDKTAAEGKTVFRSWDGTNYTEQATIINGVIDLDLRATISHNMVDGLPNGTFNTSKTYLGGLHFDNLSGLSGSARQTGITWQGNFENEAQAGIYVVNDNSSGTHMAFATTGSYAAGPQQSLTINSEGNVTVNRGDLGLSNGRLFITPSATATRKIVLWDGIWDDDYRFYGFGVESQTLVFSIPQPADRFAWYRGDTQTSRTLIATLSGAGLLDVQGLSINGTTVIDSSRNLSNVGVTSGEAEYGISLNGNFGQWQSHSTYTDFNTDVAYWGWNYVQGAINQPVDISTQWYRNRVSLGDAYGFGSAISDYWLEMAYPRYGSGDGLNKNAQLTRGAMWMRTCENGTRGSWSEVGSNLYSGLAIRGNTVIDTSRNINAYGVYLGYWSASTTSPVGRIGQVSDRTTGTITNQIGGSTSSKWEIVDYGWTTVLASVENNGVFTSYNTINTQVGGYQINGTTVIDTSRNFWGTRGKFTTAVHHGSLLYWKSRDNGGGSEYVLEHSTTDTLSDSNIKWRVNSSGTTNQSGSLQIGGTTVIDTSRNLTNININKFRESPYSPYISSIDPNTLNAAHDGVGDGFDMWINYRGYQNGTTYFRDFRIGDGKTNCLLFVDGSSGVFTFGSTKNAAIYLQGGGAAWSDGGDQGRGTGSIHLDPGTSADHTGSAITWGASDADSGTSAQAGIYVRSDGSYGTKMYFSTTDSYATGSRTAMYLDHAGTLRLQRSYAAMGELRFNDSTARRMYGAYLGAGNNAIRCEGNWDNFDIMGRVLDWTGSNLHIGGYNGIDHSPYYVEIQVVSYMRVHGSIYANGDVIAYYSDRRLKQNIETIPNALEIIGKIRGCTFEWNKLSESVWHKKEGEKDFGLISQEVEAAFPMGVAVQAGADIALEKGYSDPNSPNYDPLHKGDNEDTLYKTVKYDKLVALAIQGINEQQELIKKQQLEINELKSLVKQLLEK